MCWPRGSGNVISEFRSCTKTRQQTLLLLQPVSYFVRNVFIAATIFGRGDQNQTVDQTEPQNWTDFVIFAN